MIGWSDRRKCRMDVLPDCQIVRIVVLSDGRRGRNAHANDLEITLEYMCAFCCFQVPFSDFSDTIPRHATDTLQSWFCNIAETIIFHGRFLCNDELIQSECHPDYLKKKTNWKEIFLKEILRDGGLMKPRFVYGRWIWLCTHNCNIRIDIALFTTYEKPHKIRIREHRKCRCWDIAIRVAVARDNVFFINLAAEIDISFLYGTPLTRV